MPEPDGRSAADIDGPWVDPDFASGLIERCKAHWSVPVSQLPDMILATFLRQQIALSIMIPEARRRIGAGIVDGTEIYEGELAAALSDVDQ